MKKYHHHFSEEMYRRVYRLMKQNFEPPLIAAAVNLPLSTILNVISRLESRPALAGSESEGVQPPPAVQDATGEVFLDVYYFAKSRYTIVQFVGHVTAASKEIFEREARTIRTSVWKSIALQLTDVTVLDETGAALLIDLCKDLKARERYVALLAPSAVIEPAITRFKMEERTPIFGTTNAFEKGALSYRPASSSSRSRVKGRR
jgi:anti-anti-sigma regulatory factor